MSKEEIIESLKDIAKFIEWDYPMEYQIAIEEAIRIIRESENENRID